MIHRAPLLLFFVLSVILSQKITFASEREVDSVDLFMEIQKKIWQRTTEKGCEAFGVLVGLIISSGLGAVIDGVRLPHAVLKSRLEGCLSPQRILINQFMDEYPRASLLCSSESDSVKLFDSFCLNTHGKTLDDLLVPWQGKASEDLRKEITVTLVKIQDIFSNSHDLRAFYGQMGLEQDVGAFLKRVNFK